MILRKKSDFDNLMGFTDFELSEWQQWDLSDKEMVLDQVTFDMGSRRRMREEEQIWQKSQQRKLILAALSSRGLGIVAGLLLMIFYTTKFGLRIIILQIARQ